MMHHILTKSTNEEEIGDFCPVFYNAFSRSAHSVEALRTLYSTQTERDDLLLPRISFYSFFSFFAMYHWSRRIFFLDYFNNLCSWPNGHCANKWRVPFTLSPQQVLALDKTFVTISNTVLFTYTAEVNTQGL